MPIHCPICQNAAHLMAKHPDADIYRCNSCTHAFSDIASMPKQGGSVLDVGCGRGDFLRHVSKTRPDARLTGIDFSPNQDETIRFLQGDIITLDIGECFDVVVSLSVIE